MPTWTSKQYSRHCQWTCSNYARRFAQVLSKCETPAHEGRGHRCKSAAATISWYDHSYSHSLCQEKTISGNREYLLEASWTLWRRSLNTSSTNDPRCRRRVRCQKSWGRIWGYRAKNSAKRVNYESSWRRRRWGCRTKRAKCNQVPSTSGEVSAVQSKSRTGPNEADGKVLRRSMWKAKQRWRKEDYNLWFPIHRIFTQHSLHS